MATEPNGMSVDMTVTIDQNPSDNKTIFDSSRGIGFISGDNSIASGVEINGLQWSPVTEDDRRKPLITDYENHGLGDYLINLAGKSLYISYGNDIMELSFNDARRSTDSEISWNPNDTSDGLHRIYINSTANPLFILNSNNPIYIGTE